MKNKNDKILFATRTELAAAIALGCLNLLLTALVAELWSVPAIIPAVCFTLIYLIEIALMGIKRERGAKEITTVELADFMSEAGSVVVKATAAPVVAMDSRGTVLWYNEAMHLVLDEYGNFIGTNVSELLHAELDTFNISGARVDLYGRLYDLQGYSVTEQGDGLFLLQLDDVTDLVVANKKYVDERMVVAYIAIDNVEDVLQYVHEKFRDAVSAVDEKIKSWIASMNGIIKSYDNDKYIALIDSVELERCIENRFSILDEIRGTRVGDGVSVTASIGISKIEGTLADREVAARSAIDMALERGGDQAVYKTDEGIEYYGGRTKTVYKRSNIRSRTFTNQLLSLMSRADNVIVMGHRYGDFDSFGASIGVVRLATLCGARVNVAVDMRDANLSPFIDLMQKSEDYSKTFVDIAEALDLLTPDTLVILVDHNSFSRAQFSDIAAKVNNVAVIDHHRKSEALPESVKLSYIEPSASSTCELITEMLENAISSRYLLKEEADIILAGILLDTKQFTRNTGTRTFGAAQYLRGAGANPSDVYGLFKTDPEDLSKEARFHTSITIYKENIAISSCDGDTDDTYRVIASKAADKMLTLKGIEAAFTLVRIGDHIHISARSSGKINVQLILEKLGGGGHFDIAGAQVISESAVAVLERLKASIDDYLDEIEK
jgi:c-di-AMP phosphodiesterase-like protein